MRYSYQLDTTSRQDTNLGHEGRVLSQQGPPHQQQLLVCLLPGATQDWRRMAEQRSPACALVATLARPLRACAYLARAEGISSAVRLQGMQGWQAVPRSCSEAVLCCGECGAVRCHAVLCCRMPLQQSMAMPNPQVPRMAAAA